MATNSIHNILIDFKKSHDSYVFDKNSNREYLDFMNMFSSLPLGYSALRNNEEFQNDLLEVAHIKNTNCEYHTEQFYEFKEEFKKFVSPDNTYTNLHFSCTGALAVELAIKTALQVKRIPEQGLKIMVHSKGFHGVMGYGNFVTDKTNPIAERFARFPSFMQKNVHFFNTVEELESHGSFRVGCVLIEPIKSTNGDIYSDYSFFHTLSNYCNNNKIPLIFDEIQTGFGTTGKVWYHEHLGLTPDIVIFGKKSQVSGVMAKDEFREIFNSQNAKKICVTFDGDLIDMIRCKHIIRYIRENNLMDLIQINSFNLISNLHAHHKNVRGFGYLIAFDLSSTLERDEFVNKMKDEGILLNPTGISTVRLRPNLNLSRQEVESACRILC